MGRLLTACVVGAVLGAGCMTAGAPAGDAASDAPVDPPPYVWVSNCGAHVHIRKDLCPGAEATPAPTAPDCTETGVREGQPCDVPQTRCFWFSEWGDGCRPYLIYLTCTPPPVGWKGETICPG